MTGEPEKEVQKQKNEAKKRKEMKKLFKTEYSIQQTMSSDE